MTTVYLGLGSNIEPKEEHIRQAVHLLRNHSRITLKKASSLYLTEPVGYKEQDWFLNAVVSCDTDLGPLELLQELKKMEADLMRERTVRWGPRTIDIDLLLYGEEEISLPELVVPHPRGFQRAFVLVPLAEIAGEEPIFRGKTARDLLAELGQEEKVEWYKECPQLMECPQSERKKQNV
jgi:2-amino-4-hydroxy-6-hydroxymethyldihydropteridine diphosphokinase